MHTYKQIAIILFTRLFNSLLSSFNPAICIFYSLQSSWNLLFLQYQSFAYIFAVSILVSQGYLNIGFIILLYIFSFESLSTPLFSVVWLSRHHCCFAGWIHQLCSLIVTAVSKYIISNTSSLIFLCNSNLRSVSLH